MDEFEQELQRSAVEEINKQNAGGWTALILASRNSRTDSHDRVVLLLIQAGANVNAQANDGSSVLMRSAWFGLTSSQSSTTELLLQAGAVLDLKNLTGHTALDSSLSAEARDYPTEADNGTLFLLVRESRRFPALFKTHAAKQDRTGDVFRHACLLIMQRDTERLSERAAFDRAVIEIAPVARNLTGGNSTDSLVKQYL